MDLSGIPKRAWRARLIEAYQTITNNRTLPSNRFFFTLGGPSVDSDTFFKEKNPPAPDSELGYLYRHRGFLQPQQYVSVEHDIKIHTPNTVIQGPTWIHGDFAEAFYAWYQKLPMTHDVGIISADLMCGIATALPTLRSIFRTLLLFSNQEDKILVSFNILQGNRWRENMGIEFADVWNMVQKDPAMHIFMHNGVSLVDKFQYDNKTIGKGAGNSTLQTLIFTYQRMNKERETETMSTKKSTKSTSKKAPVRKADDRDKGARTLPVSKTAPKKSAQQKKWSEAAKKSWATRRANAKKNASVKKAK